MLKQLVKDTHCMPIRPHILRVVALKESGVALLQGSDDATVNHHASRLSQCFIADVRHPRVPWEVCAHGCSPLPVRGSKRGAQVMLLCDACNKGFHIWCVDIPLSWVPIGN